MEKSEFIKLKASEKTKNLNFIAWIIFSICIFAMAFSIYNSNYGDFRKIPAFKIALGEKVEELNREFDKQYEKLSSEDSLLPSHELRAIENFRSRFSFASLITLAEIGKDPLYSGLSEISSAFLKVVAVAAIISAVITLIAVSLKSRIALTFSFVLSLGTSLISGLLPLILTIVTHLALFIIFGIINEEYKSYNK